MPILPNLALLLSLLLMDQSKVISRLDELANLANDRNVGSSHMCRSIQSFLVSVGYAENSMQVTNIKDCLTRLSFAGTDYTQHDKDKMRNLILQLIKDIEITGLPTPALAGGTGPVINMIQTQQQTLTVSIVLEQLRHQLSDSQRAELEAELNSPAPEKDKRVLAKLKAFGIDVLANAMANLLTNPLFGG